MTGDLMQNVWYLAQTFGMLAIAVYVLWLCLRKGPFSATEVVRDLSAAESRRQRQEEQRVAEIRRRCRRYYERTISTDLRRQKARQITAGKQTITLIFDLSFEAVRNLLGMDILSGEVIMDDDHVAEVLRIMQEVMKTEGRLIAVVHTSLSDSSFGKRIRGDASLTAVFYAELNSTGNVQLEEPAVIPV